MELLLQLRQLFVGEIGASRVICGRRQAAAAQAARDGTAYRSHRSRTACIHAQTHASQSQAHTGSAGIAGRRWIIGQQQGILYGGWQDSPVAAHIQMTIQLIVVHVGR